MKKALISILAISALLCTACKQSEKTEEEENKAESVSIAKGSIVYFNLEKVIEEYDMANELRSEVETKVSAISKDVERRQKNLENAAKDFNNKINKGLITSAAANEQGKKLQQQEAAFNQFAQQKQNEILEEQQVMMNRILDAIKTYVEYYNIDKEFSMILANQSGIPVVVADTTLDITDEIIAGLNAEYVKNKND